MKLTLKIKDNVVPKGSELSIDAVYLARPEIIYARKIYIIVRVKLTDEPAQEMQSDTPLRLVDEIEIDDKYDKFPIEVYFDGVDRQWLHENASAIEMNAGGLNLLTAAAMAEYPYSYLIYTSDIEPAKEFFDKIQQLNPCCYRRPDVAMVQDESTPEADKKEVSKHDCAGDVDSGESEESEDSDELLCTPVSQETLQSPPLTIPKSHEVQTTMPVDSSLQQAESTPIHQTIDKICAELNQPDVTDIHVLLRLNELQQANVTAEQIEAALEELSVAQGQLKQGLVLVEQAATEAAEVEAEEVEAEESETAEEAEAQAQAQAQAEAKTVEVPRQPMIVTSKSGVQAGGFFSQLFASRNALFVGFAAGVVTAGLAAQYLYGDTENSGPKM